MIDNDALGTVVDGDTIIFEREVAHPPERVWRAISDDAELCAWMRYPVSFTPTVGATVRFFGDDHIEGVVFIVDEPRTLAFSFENAGDAQKIAAEWTVRWDLEATAVGCRITFQHRRLGGAHLWGLGEGWHGFLDQLVAYTDRRLDELIRSKQVAGTGGDTALLSIYRAHVSTQLRAWAEDAAAAACSAIKGQHQDEAVRAIEQLTLSTRQFYEIARQDGPRPDYAPAPAAT